jgi:hypothetical protein
MTGRILARLPTEEMRERFRAAEPVRLIDRLATDNSQLF